MSSFDQLAGHHVTGDTNACGAQQEHSAKCSFGKWASLEKPSFEKLLRNTSTWFLKKVVLIKVGETDQNENLKFRIPVAWQHAFWIRISKDFLSARAPQKHGQKARSSENAQSLWSEMPWTKYLDGLKWNVMRYEVIGFLVNSMNKGMQGLVDWKPHFTTSLLGDGHEIRGVELLHISTFSCVQIKTDGISKPAEENLKSVDKTC